MLWQEATEAWMLPQGIVDLHTPNLVCVHVPNCSKKQIVRKLKQGWRKNAKNQTHDFLAIVGVTCLVCRCFLVASATRQATVSSNQQHVRALSGSFWPRQATSTKTSQQSQ